MEIGHRPHNAYSDRISVRPGETIRFLVSCEGPETYDARVVRLVCADDNPRGAPFRAEPVVSPLEGRHTGRPQVIHAGSHGLVPASPAFACASLTLQALVMPTTPDKVRQAILGTWSQSSHTGTSLIVGDDGALGLIAGDGRASTVVTTGVQRNRFAGSADGVEILINEGRAMVVIETIVSADEAHHVVDVVGVVGHALQRATQFIYLLIADTTMFGMVLALHPAVPTLAGQ